MLVPGELALDRSALAGDQCLLERALRLLEHEPALLALEHALVEIGELGTAELEAVRQRGVVLALVGSDLALNGQELDRQPFDLLLEEIIGL